MSKYIDAEKILTKIEWLKGINNRIVCETNKEYCRGYVDAIEDILHSITSLQQESSPSKEEVADRIADWISRNPDFFFNGDTKEVMNEIKKLV